VNETELKAIVLTALGQVAPEADPAALDPTVPIADQVEIDSMDFLDFVVALAERTGIEVPERDYTELSTVDGCVSYLSGHTQAPASRSAARVRPGERRQGTDAWV
jgi:acyl carrier protein